MIKKHNSQSSYNLISLLTISVIAILFGGWFSLMQVKTVSLEAFSSYPKEYFFLTVFKCYCVILTFFAFSQLILSQVSLGKIKALHTALSYAPLLLVFIALPMYWVGSLVLLIQVGLLGVTLQAKDYERIQRSYSTDILVLVLFFICHLIMTSRFSPLQWNVAMLTADGYNSEELHVVAPIFQGYLLAKQFVFSNFDHAQWAGIMHPPVTLASPFMQLLDFIFDFPSVSYESFHQLLSLIYFLLMIMGSFGFYLFIKYAAKINGLFAFFGGYLFMFSGNPLLSQMFTSDGGIFLAPLVVFPFALLCISKAFEKNDYRYSAWAGLALAAQFFLLTPHPEGTMYSLFFFCVYTLGLFLFSWQLRWKDRFMLAVVSVIAVFALSAFYLAPIVADQIKGNMFVFAHSNDINVTYFFYFKEYVRLLILFAPISFVFLFCYKKMSPTYLSSLFLALALLGFVFIILNEGLIKLLVDFLHMGVHFWVPSRIGVYFYTSVFIISIYGLDALTSVIYDVIKNKKFIASHRGR